MFEELKLDTIIAKADGIEMKISADKLSVIICNCEVILRVAIGEGKYVNIALPQSDASARPTGTWHNDI